MATITVDTSALVDGTNADAGDVGTPVANLKTAIENVINGVQKFDQMTMANATTLTIASDAITITQSYHKVDTEAAAASDDLSTISGGSEGDILFLKSVNSSRDVTLKNAVGNIKMNSGSDFVLSSTDRMVLFVFDGTNWIGHDAASTAVDWANPGTIGSTTPSSIVGTTVVGNTSVASPIGNITTVNSTTVNATDVNATRNNGRAMMTASAVGASSGNIPAGVEPTVPVEGDFWNDSTQKDLVNFINGIKQGYNGILFTNNAVKSINNTNVETTMFPTGVGGLTLPAGFLTAGKMIHVHIEATYSNVASAVETFRFKLGGATLVSRALTHNGAINSNFNMQIDLYLSCYTTGVSGTVRVNGAVTALNNAVHFLVSTATNTVDTTAALAIDFTAQWTAANAGNLFAVTNALVEVMN